MVSTTTLSGPEIGGGRRRGYAALVHRVHQRALEPHEVGKGAGGVGEQARPRQPVAGPLRRVGVRRQSEPVLDLGQAHETQRARVARQPLGQIGRVIVIAAAAAEQCQQGERWSEPAHAQRCRSTSSTLPLLASILTTLEAPDVPSRSPGIERFTNQ